MFVFPSPAGCADVAAAEALASVGSASTCIADNGLVNVDPSLALPTLPDAELLDAAAATKPALLLTAEEDVYGLASLLLMGNGELCWLLPTAVYGFRLKHCSVDGSVKADQPRWFSLQPTRPQDLPLAPSKHCSLDSRCYRPRHCCH